jgi:phosphosulfolactate synthase (CoM biosynthesis protein A)
MSVKYIPYGNTKVVINKVVYQNLDGKNALLPVDKIGKDELEKLLKEKLIVKLEFDESGKPSGDKDASRAEKKREALVAKAKEFGITVTDEMTVEEIQQAIRKAADDKRKEVKDKPLNEMSKDELKAKAKELGIDSGFFESEEKLREKILEAQEKK